ncbi:ribonuclease H-like domain-containing protein [Tanacetum coccineum]
MGSNQVRCPTSTNIGQSTSHSVPRQETTLPHVFSATALQDPTSDAWNMDTSVSSHLNDSVTSLSDVLNMCIYPSVSVGDGYTILVTNSRHNFITRWVLLRCDSTEDLYPVTKPSTIPHAFLTSQYTWHQLLGHLGSEVLRRILSSKLISCSKEKPLILCHTCQLGKHVRLPFVSSNTLFKSGLDIVHSDLWTSPILSLSGFKYYVLFLDHYS